MQKIGFIGAGNMAEALLKGLISSGVFTKERILVSDVLQERLELMSSAYGVKTTQDNRDVARFSDLIVLSVKPSTVGKVVEEIKGFLTPRKLLVSIAAGIPVSFIAGKIKKKTKIVRVMPNTPALVLSGVSVLYCNSLVTPGEKENIVKIFKSVGEAFTVESEELLNPVTGLSGSGPAFVAMFIEALADGGVKAGLSRNMALRLAVQTVYGTAKMIIDSGIHPAELKDKVASPAGTTIEGIKELEVRGFRGGVISAVESATRRSKELSKEGK